MSLKPPDDLAEEFIRDAAKEINANQDVDRALRLIFCQHIAARDDEHAALLVTTDAYAKGFAAGVDHEKDRRESLANFIDSDDGG